MKQLWMGNEAIAYGALRAGVRVVTGYPGTPSTEVLETIAKAKAKGLCDSTYVEWSVNEKAALEVAAGAAYAGARTLVTMKQVGLNVASDPLMSLAYVGVKGGMVILVADDPGPISSQTEQDTRSFAAFSKLPVFDPCSPEEAYTMMADAFALSEQCGTPVLFRPTTRICHANAAIEPLENLPVAEPEGFVKDTSRWVIFPRTSFLNHQKIEKRNRELQHTLSQYPGNAILYKNTGRVGLAAGGVSYAYLREAMQLLGVELPLLKVATPFPFPTDLAREFLQSTDRVLVFEELDPVIERELTYLCGKEHLPTEICGKLSDHTASAGENSVEATCAVLAAFLGIDAPAVPAPLDQPLPVRPPSLCAGCPHRASFYAVKQALKGRKTLYGGDIGCYTLGNAMPLDMVDTCLCMGAGITVSQGVRRVEPDTVTVSFTGDSTFFHTGMVGIANAVYNGTRLLAVILDNHTTAMTGHQPNPSTGFAATGEVAEKIPIEGVLKALGVADLQIVDPLDLDAAIAAVKHAADVDGVSAIIFRSPCIAVTKPGPQRFVDEAKCIGCRKCIREIGCPAISISGKKVAVDPTLCYGCDLCAKLCPTGALITKEGGRA